MHETTIDRFTVPAPTSQDVMTEILRAGAQKLLAEMIQAEVEDWLAKRAQLKDEQGRRQVVRNGYLPEREITTGVGPVKVRQPRVRDRRPAGEAEPFSSKILPAYLRKTNPIESTFATVRLRTKRTKGSGSRTACLTMVYKLMQSASTNWRLLNGSQLIPEVIQGVPFVDGIRAQEVAA